MRRILVVTWMVLCVTTVAWTQEPPYRVVFDLTSSDSLNQHAVTRWIKEIMQTDPEAEIEVVMYGKGFELVMPERSKFPAEVRSALNNPNVSFRVCEIALKNNKVDKSALFEKVGTVPDGIYEIVSKQAKGWGYIKVAR
jgi:uncharacterized protein